MSMAVVRNRSSVRALGTARDVEDGTQELVDQRALAMAAARINDGQPRYANALGRPDLSGPAAESSGTPAPT